MEFMIFCQYEAWCNFKLIFCMQNAWNNFWQGIQIALFKPCIIFSTYHYNIFLIQTMHDQIQDVFLFSTQGFRAFLDFLALLVSSSCMAVSFLVFPVSDIQEQQHFSSQSLQSCFPVSFSSVCNEGFNFFSVAANVSCSCFLCFQILMVSSFLTIGTWNVFTA